jgi:EAL domain-containing protein (putative c-di-GMP-specific phosphodiesterase class I)
MTTAKGTAVAAKALERYAGMSVLIVDDNAGNVALLKALLVAEGLQRVYSETDSRQVPRRLAEQQPDLVLLDLHMPHVDGHEVLGQIKVFAAGSYLPVLVLTGDTTTVARNRALGQGAQDFLLKPLDITEATLRIANLLETRQLYATLRRASVTPELERLESQLDHHEVRTRIERVLRTHGVAPVYQPVLDVNTLATVGHEGLSRFEDSALGGPDRWFADAFAVGLGVDLEWLAAVAMLPLLDTIPADNFLAINMSPATILHMVDRELCAPADCPRVVIELTEHVPVEDYTAVERALAQMRSNGARLAADDLGSSYAGFRHLVSLKPDIIKLDISLVAGIHRSAAQRALSSALVTFAADIGATVIGEGVEQAEELEVLRAIGVPWAQGYHLGRPAAHPRSVAVA